eukprot:gene4419-14550_t
MLPLLLPPCCPPYGQGLAEPREALQAGQNGEPDEEHGGPLGRQVQPPVQPRRAKVVVPDPNSSDVQTTVSNR